MYKEVSFEVQSLIRDRITSTAIQPSRAFEILGRQKADPPAERVVDLFRRFAPKIRVMQVPSPPIPNS